MNKVILIGRLTADPTIRKTAGEENTVAYFTLAVDRRVARKEGQQTADFIPCQAWNKKAEYADKYMRKGKKFVVTGRIQTGQYDKEDGTKVYTQTVVCEDIEFGENKASDQESPAAESNSNSPFDGFMNIPEGIDEDLPFAAPGR